MGHAVVEAGLVVVFGVAGEVAADGPGEAG